MIFQSYIKNNTTKQNKNQKVKNYFFFKNIILDLKYLINDSPTHKKESEEDKKFELLDALLKGKNEVLQTVSESNESKASQIMQSLLKGFYKTTKNSLNLNGYIILVI